MLGCPEGCAAPGQVLVYDHSVLLQGLQPAAAYRVTVSAEDDYDSVSASTLPRGEFEVTYSWNRFAVGMVSDVGKKKNKYKAHYCSGLKKMGVTKARCNNLGARGIR